MSDMTDYLETMIGNLLFCSQVAWKPAAIWVALFRATRGFSNQIRFASVSAGDTVIPATPNGHVYRCTTGGTTGSGEPSWNIGSGSTTSDGTAVWTEMTPDFDQNTANLTPIIGAGYGRVQVTQADAQWNAPVGGDGHFDNVNEIVYGSPTADWGVVVALGIYDASSGGNMFIWHMLATPKTVNNGDPAPKFAAGALDVTFQ